MHTLRERLTTEDTVEAHGVKRCKRHRGKNIKTDRVFAGWPDQMFIMPGGVVFFIEFKRPVGGRFETRQLFKHKMLRLLGFKVYVCRTKAQTDAAFEEMGFAL